MKILVTGGAGFIGSHLVDELIRKKHKVTVIDDLSAGNKIFVNKKAFFFKKKIQDRSVYTIFKNKKFDIVFHLAAQKNLQYSNKFPVLDAETNILGSLNILDASIRYGVKKFIFYSTAAVYDSKATPPNTEKDILNPVTPYGIAKSVFEKYLVNSNINYTVLRLANVYGPRQDVLGEGGVVSVFCKNLTNNKSSIIYNSGNYTRDYIFVSDVVNASIKVIAKGSNKIFNISTNKETSVNDLYVQLSVIADSQLKPKKGGKLIEQKRSALNNNYAKKEFNWIPKVEIKKGLIKTFNWFNK